MNAPIEIKAVSKSFKNKHVLHQIDLTIESGQIFGLIGPSGSGKTTLVKIIVGMDSPSKGNVQVLGKDVPHLQLLRQIGYMAQADALYNDLTGAENLAFFGSLFNIKKDQLQERIAYVANLVQLTNDLKKKVEYYSGGMKRRLSLAVALIQDPQVLILDEPTVGIDPELRQSIWTELQRLKQTGKTILLTTHVMDEADKCDQLAMLREGKIITSGSPLQLKEQHQVNNLEEVFLAAGGGQK